MPNTPAEPVSQRPAHRMGLMLIGIGTAHFLAPKPFDTIVPAELPGGARFYTQASGAAEVAVGTLLLVPRTRRLAALAAAALYLAVFPANLNMVRLWRDKPLPMRLAALARLPMQVPMVTRALAIRRNAPRRG